MNPDTRQSNSLDDYDYQKRTGFRNVDGVLTELAKIAPHVRMYYFSIS